MRSTPDVKVFKTFIFFVADAEAKVNVPGKFSTARPMFSTMHGFTHYHNLRESYCYSYQKGLKNLSETTVAFLLRYCWISKIS